MMAFLDPTAASVFSVYALLALLILLVAAAGRQRLSVGHGLTVLMLFVVFSRVFFFDYAYEVYGEGSFYIAHMVEGIVPGLNPIYDLGPNPPAMFMLFYFANHIVGLDPVISLKAFRVVLGGLDVLLVYLIGRRLFREPRLALGAAMMFAFAEVQLTFFEGDQFKNLLGHTFFLAFVLIGIDWLEPFTRDRSAQVRRLIMLVVLGIAMVLSHQVYAHILAGILALIALGFVLSAATERLFGRRPGLGLALTLIAAAGAGYAFWFQEFLPRLGAEGYVQLTEWEYGSLTLLDEVLKPGVLFYNIWISIATVGAMLCIRHERQRHSVAFLLTLFGFFTVLAKQYVFGLLFQPVRFLMIDGPFLALFSVYGLWRLSSRLGSLGDRLMWIGIGLLMLGNLAVMELGSARLNLTRNGLRVPVTNATTYLFGGPAPDLQLWLLLLLSFVVVAAVASTTSDSAGAGRADATLGVSGFVFLGLMVSGIILGAVWAFEPFRLGAMPLQFVALLFPVWALGWLPWRAIDPAHGPDSRLTQLVMVPVTSLVLFVVTWYVMLAPDIWGFTTAIRWSTVVTFIGPTGLLVLLAGTTRLRTRWHA
jgi:hypothetical protein